MKSLVLRLVTSRRVWLLVGLPIAAYVALSAVANVSLLPPEIKGRNLGVVTARTQLYVLPHAQLYTTPPEPLADTVWTQSAEQATVLANLLTSPDMRTAIARDAGIDARRLAVDGPISADLPNTDIWPAGEKRANQIVAESALYRLTIDANPSAPVIGIAAQGPTATQAVRLAEGTRTALSSYLTSLQTKAHVPVAQRPGVSALGAVAVSGDSSGGPRNVATLTFIVSLTLWIGLVYTFAAVARDIRRLRRAPIAHASPRPDQPLSPW